MQFGLQTLRKKGCTRVPKEITWKWCHPLEISENCWVQERLPVRNCTGPTEACCRRHYLLHGKDDRLHVAGNGMRTMCAISWRASPAPHSSHEWTMGNLWVTVYLLKIIVLKCPSGPSVLLKDTSAGRMLADTEVLNPALCGGRPAGYLVQLMCHFRAKKKQQRFQRESSWTAQKWDHKSRVIALRWQVGLFLHLPSK